MKLKTLFTTIILLLISNLYCFTQLPVIQWDNTIGSTGDDYLIDSDPTADGGYILGGYTSGGITGDKSEPSFGGTDYWVVKLSNTGVIEWQKSYGGLDFDNLRSIEQTSDGGYIIGGDTYSGVSGNKTTPAYGNYDYWIIKINAVGDIEWQKSLGGSSEDFLQTIHQTSDDNYLVAGYSRSPISGNKTEKALGGSQDYWVIKLDTVGNIIWQNDIGGSLNDMLIDMAVTIDGGCVLSGGTYSQMGGDKTENTVGGVNSDYWIVKLNASGNIVWQNNLGGDNHEGSPSIIQTADGGYLTIGESASNISGDKTENCYGDLDVWVVKLNAAGNIQWQKTIGGNDYEYISLGITTEDGGYLIGCTSISPISGTKTVPCLGDYDVWLVRLSITGDILWDDVVGNTGYDWLVSLDLTLDGGYFVGAFSNSPASAQKSENSIGGSDYWTIKFASEICTPEVCNGSDDDCNGLIDDGLSFIVSTSAAGATTFCQGGSVTLTATGTGPNYKWKKNGSYIGGATSTTYIASTTGNFTCENFDPCAVAESTPIVVTVNKLPTATITAGGATTFCSGGSVILSANTGGGLSYQWYKGASTIAGATSPNYTATSTGNYKCRVTKLATGCLKYSNVIHVSVPCKKNDELLYLNDSGDFIVYPNPNNGTFTISAPLPAANAEEQAGETNGIELEIYNSLGQIIYSKQLESTNNINETISLDNISSGIYFVRMGERNNFSDQKLIIEK